MVILFVLLLVNLLTIWFKYEKTSTYLLLLNLVIGSVTFFHHITSHLTIQL
jgi:hypothetical protein